MGATYRNEPPWEKPHPWQTVRDALGGPEVVAALRSYMAVIGNTGYQVSRESAAELYLAAEAAIAKATSP